MIKDFTAERLPDAESSVQNHTKLLILPLIKIGTISARTERKKFVWFTILLQKKAEKENIWKRLYETIWNYFHYYLRKKIESLFRRRFSKELKSIYNDWIMLFWLKHQRFHAILNIKRKTPCFCRLLLPSTLNASPTVMWCNISFDLQNWRNEKKKC